MTQIVDAGLTRQKKLGYWESRKHMLYYKSVFQFACVAGYDAQSVIDVGSASAEYLQWLHWIPERAMLDFRIPKKVEGFTCIETDFFDFKPEKTYDLALCCQVLEHVEDPKAFCDKLKTISKRLLITVPYKWRGNAPGHLHDPVDEAKLRSWMQVAPNCQQVVSEPFRASRLVAYYDLENGPKERFEKGFVFEAIARHSEAADKV